MSGFAPIKMRNHSIISMNSEDIAMLRDAPPGLAPGRCQLCR
jgi:hypothetical protein